MRRIFDSGNITQAIVATEDDLKIGATRNVPLLDATLCNLVATAAGAHLGMQHVIPGFVNYFDEDRAVEYDRMCEQLIAECTDGQRAAIRRILAAVQKTVNPHCQKATVALTKAFEVFAEKDELAIA